MVQRNRGAGVPLWFFVCLFVLFIQHKKLIVSAGVFFLPAIAIKTKFLCLFALGFFPFTPLFDVGQLSD